MASLLKQRCSAANLTVIVSVLLLLGLGTLTGGASSTQRLSESEGDSLAGSVRSKALSGKDHLTTDNDEHILKDPCKASLFLGDIALDDQDVEDIFGETIQQFTDRIGKDIIKAKQLREDKEGEDMTDTKRQNYLLHRNDGNNKTGSAEKPRFRIPTLKDIARMRNHGEMNRWRRKEHETRRTQRRVRHRSRIQRTEDVHKRTARAATARPERLWPSGVIPYVIGANFTESQRALFKQAMRHWESQTCITFIERTAEEAYVKFTSRPCGCCSYVGRRGDGPQAISIGKNCDKFGIIVHELGHVVGFWHEHTRPDRDQYITIVYRNIQEGQEYNFEKMDSSEIDSLGETYDYHSIMHYARNTFSKGTFLDTIRPRADKAGIRPHVGQRAHLSKGDIAQAMKLYRCPTCGRTLQEQVGNITSPNYPGNYPLKTDCIWRINAAEGEKILLDISELDIHESRDCYDDYLEIRDGHWHRSRLLGRFCGQLLPVTINSTGSRLWIKFKTTTNYSGLGFALKYKSVCGGTIEKEFGHIHSPNYPENYSPSRECVWKMIVDDGFRISFSFQSFDIESHDSCSYDYLEIRDGSNDNSELIGRFCGSDIPGHFTSSSNTLWIKFSSDGSVNKAGFAAKFFKEIDECAAKEPNSCQQECVNTAGSYKCDCRPGYELNSDGKTCDAACGGYFSNSDGYITSPNWPNRYPMNKQCLWQIAAPAQHRISIRFEVFDLEGNEVCKYDYIEVTSSSTEGDKLHGRFCGKQPPPVITSTANQLRLLFKSDATVSKRGFKIKVFTDKDECAINNGGCEHNCANTIGSYTCSCRNGYVLHTNRRGCKEADCKHEIRSAVGEISTPNWPNKYPSRKDCIWLITTAPGHRVKVVFDEFDIEGQPECAYDHLELYDGRDADQNVMGRFCGSKVPDEVIAATNFMFMKFISDSTVQRRGFIATHTTVCGGNLTALSRSRSFYSHPQYGDTNYISAQECDWIISSDSEYGVKLTFSAFNVEEESDCSYDFLEVYDGPTDSASRFGRYCGQDTPVDIYSLSESLLVRFHSDNSINKKGFHARYSITNPEEIPFIPASILDHEGSE